MKENYRELIEIADAVAPLVGAWIERYWILAKAFPKWVAPLVGAWIERHLKRPLRFQQTVAPLVGAWIERLMRDTFDWDVNGRTPRGCVD